MIHARRSSNSGWSAGVPFRAVHRHDYAVLGVSLQKWSVSKQTVLLIPPCCFDVDSFGLAHPLLAPDHQGPALVGFLAGAFPNTLWRNSTPFWAPELLGPLLRGTS